MLELESIRERPKCDKLSVRDVLARYLLALFFHGVEYTLHPASVVDALKAKSLQVSPRALILSAAGVIIPEQPEEVYIDYITALFGGERPVVYAPQSAGAMNEELDTAKLVLESPALVAQIREYAPREMMGYISSREMHGLADATSLTVLGTGRDSLSVVERAGNKSYMADIFAEFGMRPHQILGRSADTQEVLRIAKRTLDEYGACTLRSFALDGGLGVVHVTRGEDPYECVRRGRSDRSTEEFFGNGVLVERRHNVVGAPAALGLVHDGEVHIVQCHDQLRDSYGGSCVGILRHFDQETLFAEIYGERGSWILEQLRADTLKIGQWLANQGFEGFFSLDEMLCLDDGKYELRCSEVNPRCTAANVGLMLGYRLGLLDDRVILTNDQVKLGEKKTFEEVQSIIEECGYSYDPEHRLGVVITIPPHPEVHSFGYAVVGDSYESVQLLNALIGGLFSRK